METIIVSLIVAIAAVYVALTFYRQFKGKSGCASGCNCNPNIKAMCDDPRKDLETFQNQ